MPTDDADLAQRLKDAFDTGETIGDAAPAGRSATDRILDAASLRFAEVGVKRTTMSSIAAEAGLSREWMYQHFSNRDAIVTGVLQRELRRFIDGLAVRASEQQDVPGAIEEAFVYSVEFLRDRPVLIGLTERGFQPGEFDPRDHAGELLGATVRTFAGYLVDRGGFELMRARIVAETLTRLVGSTVVAPHAELDLHDPDTLRTYARTVVPALVGAGTTETPDLGPQVATVARPAL